MHKTGTLELVNLNGMQSLLMLLIRHVLFKMSNLALYQHLLYLSLFTNTFEAKSFLSEYFLWCSGAQDWRVFPPMLKKNDSKHRLIAVFGQR